MDDYSVYESRIRELLLEELDMKQDPDDAEILEHIDNILLRLPLLACLTISEKQRIRRGIFHSLRKLDVLEELLEEPGITEIMVNGPDHIFYEKNGRLVRSEKHFASGQKLEEVIRQIAGKCNRVINETSPMVDARLEDGSRIHAVVFPVALNGPILTIRRFPERPMTMETLIQRGSITEEAADFLKELVRARYSIMIGGGTGSGKTTLLGALAEYIPGDERLITIEDNAELRIPGKENLVRLEAKNANLEDGHSITIRDLIRTALRMRPDRILVGEVRGEEALDLLQALNTGHDGSLSTAHANSAKDMMSRLETMTIMGASLPLEAIRRQIASGIDIAVHLGRMPDGSRRVLEIAEVTGVRDGEIRMQPLFLFEDGILEKRGELRQCDKLQYGRTKPE